MNVKIYPSRLSGEICAPPSKSFAHRELICAALAEGESEVCGVSQSEDMLATLDCLAALGAHCERCGDTVHIRGIAGKTPEGALLPCRESGSTLRFLVPLSLTGGELRFEGAPRLLERGIGLYEELLGEKGIEIKKDSGGITLRGRLESGEYTLRGDVSSQFVSGLLFALPRLSGDSVIRVLPPVESRAYIDITLQVLAQFGIEICERAANEFYVRGGQKYRARRVCVEGDWSNAAALYAFNCVGGSVKVRSLREDSVQGDRVCLEYFKALGSPGAVLDISNCPDLGPVLFAAAAAMGKGAEFTGTRRLRIKESDRAAVMAQCLERFGIGCEIEDNSLTVLPGKLRAPSAPVSSHNDHRIVMALTLLMSVTGGEILSAQAVRKSYPDFFEQLRAIGLEAEYEDR